MSGGSGGSGSGFGSGGGGGTITDCQKVSIKTSVTSPNPAVLAILSVGDKLDITLQTATGPLIAVTNAGSVLGAVFTTKLSQLIECINKGYTYIATILEIDGGSCEILITAQ